MVIARAPVLAAALALAVGCRVVPVVPPPPETGPRALERTFGSAVVAPGGGLAIGYKDLRLLVDPAPGDLKAAAPDLDFLLLTVAAETWPVDVRRNLKIIGPPAAAGAARKMGFDNARPLSPDQRLMLSKAGLFLFVSAVRAAGADGRVNGYLLEFDNGRNLFLSGDRADPSAVRDFVYGLRDDGKELHLAFVSSGKAAVDEAAAAEISATLQPRVAVIVNRGGLDAGRLSEAFSAQIFNGGWHVAEPSEVVPF